MSPSRKEALLAACFTVLGLLGAAAEPKTAASTHTVTMENLQFTPQELTVNRGDRIVWMNKDFFPHTATANDKSFDSGSIAANGSWSWHATKSGDYPYGCTFHPTMKAKISVR